MKRLVADQRFLRDRRFVKGNRMCGIAGIVDLSGKRPVPAGMLRAMAAAMIHRGPDEDGFLELPGLGLASRRLSIIGLADGRQPISNEDHSVFVVYNGELFDYRERKAELEGRGHRFATHCDTEIIPHLWEDHQESTFERLRGQFGQAGGKTRVHEQTYWQIDFPDRGDEDPGRDSKKVIDEFEKILLGAVERRLRADVPVVAYLSGGVDSSTLVALACHIRGEAIPTFTIQIKDPVLDETSEAGLVARHVGARPVIVGCGAEEVLNNYSRLIQAAEGP